MSDLEYVVRITNKRGEFILAAKLHSYSMAHRFLDDQILHDGDMVELKPAFYDAGSRVTTATISTGERTNGPN